MLLSHKQALEKQASYFIEYSEQDIQLVLSILTPEEKEIINKEYSRLLEQWKPRQRILNSLGRSIGILIDIEIRRAELRKKKIEDENLFNFNRHKKKLKIRYPLDHEKLIK